LLKNFLAKQRICLKLSGCCSPVWEKLKHIYKRFVALSGKAVSFL
jgi:hypothetical protein